MSDFLPGFAARHDAAAAALVQAFPAPVFAAINLRDCPAPRRAANTDAPPTPRSFSPQAVGPKHFSPADRDARPTEGWDPLDAGSALGPDATPYIDPLAAAHAAGYAEGLAAAAAVARAENNRDRELVDGLAAAIGDTGRFDRAAVATQLRQTVLALVTKLVGEVGIAPDILAGRIDAATRLLADKTESALLRVHPDDVPLLQGRLPATVFAAGDPAVPRGSFTLESASTLVEDGPDHWLDQLAQAIELVPVPSAC